MPIKITRRQIGRQDIAFDSSGSGEKFSFQGSDGVTTSCDKINASHIPVTSRIRTLVQAISVEDALSELYDMANADNQAYETVAGVARVATEDEVRAGQVDDAFVTPRKLVSLLATAKQLGLVKLATSDDIASGANPNSVVSVATASVLAYGLPAGTGPLPWWLSAAPAGFLLADGKTYNRSDYPLLWAAVQGVAADKGGGQQFGKGDGAVTFQMPDLSKVKLGGSVSVGWMFKA